MSEFSLETVQTLDLPSLFEKPEAVKGLLDQLEAHVRAIPTDPTTDKGRQEIKSLAYKVSRSKTLLDGAGKEKGDKARLFLNKINAVRRDIVSRLDALRDEVRQPVTDYENREKERVDRIRLALNEIIRADLSDVPIEAVSCEDIEESLAGISSLYQATAWDEFAGEAGKAFEKTKSALEERLARRREYDAEVMKREQAAREEAARQQAERDAEIARLAEERAREDERRKAAEREAAILREHERAEAARIAEEERIRAAEERAARDRENQRRINSEIVQGLQDAGLSRENSISVMKLIVSGKVPHVSVNYGRL